MEDERVVYKIFGTEIEGTALFRLFLSVSMTLVIVFIMVMSRLKLAGIIEDPLGAALARESLILILAIACMLYMGHKKLMGIDNDSISYAFRIGWMFLIPGIVASMHAFYKYVIEGNTLPANAWMRVWIVLLFCLEVGFFEEYLFRGVLFGGLLGVLNSSRLTIFVAVLIDAWMFGRMHVLTYDVTNPMIVAQAVLKIIETGLFAIVMCDVALHTKRVGGAAIFHAVNDFCIMVTTVVLQGSMVTGVYTTDDPQKGRLVIITYLITVIIYAIPATLSFIRIWKERDLFD